MFLCRIGLVLISMTLLPILYGTGRAQPEDYRSQILRLVNEPSNRPNNHRVVPVGRVVMSSGAIVIDDPADVVVEQRKWSPALPVGRIGHSYSILQHDVNLGETGWKTVLLELRLLESKVAVHVERVQAEKAERGSILHAGSALCCFVDHEALSRLLESMRERQETIMKTLRDAPLPEDKMWVICNSGNANGGFPILVTRDADGNAVSLLVEFRYLGNTQPLFVRNLGSVANAISIKRVVVESGSVEVRTAEGNIEITAPFGLLSRFDVVKEGRVLVTSDRYGLFVFDGLDGKRYEKFVSRLDHIWGGELVVYGALEYTSEMLPLGDLRGQFDPAK